MPGRSLQRPFWKQLQLPKARRLSFPLRVTGSLLQTQTEKPTLLLPILLHRMLLLHLYPWSTLLLVLSVTCFLQH
jgi:hypothetical protein